eukprot:COSAG05_NODE_186_length_14726_cov_28.333630_7_plen_75_part_00
MRHRRDKDILYHAIREHNRHGLVHWVDYSSRMFVANTYSPVHSLKLDRAKTKAQADSSPAAEDEQGGPSLVDDE